MAARSGCRIRSGFTSLAALWLALLSGCVIIPYRPEAETRHVPAQVSHPELIRLSAGPQRFLAAMSAAICKADPRIEAVDGQAFIDAAAPAGELTLAELLDPATGARFEPLAVDFLVLLGEPEDQELDSAGGVVFYLGFVGLGQRTTASRHWAALIDLSRMRLVEQVESTATGTDRGVGLFYGLFILSDTRGGAEHGLVREVVAGIASQRPAGPVRVAFLASEVVRTAEEIAAANLAAERVTRQTQLFRPDSVEGYPGFSEPAPLRPDQGLIFLYRPENPYDSHWPLFMRQRSAAGEFEVLRLWGGGYLPFVSTTGTVELWVETDPERVVTLHVEPGGIYYVRASCRSWSLGRIPSRLEVVAPAIGQREVARCRQLPTTAEYVALVRAAAEEGYTFRQLELADLYARGVAYGPREGLDRDAVEACKWYSIVMASASTRPEWQSRAGIARARIVTGMTPDEIREAEHRASEWLAASSEVQ